MRAFRILDTGQAPRPLIHLTAHDLHPWVVLKLDFAGCCWDLEGPGGQWTTCSRVYLRAWSVQWRLLIQVGPRVDVDESDSPSPVLTTSTTVRPFSTPPRAGSSILSQMMILVPRHAIPACRPRTLDFVQTGSRLSYFGPVPRSSSMSHPIHAASPESRRSSTRWSQGGIRHAHPHLPSPLPFVRGDSDGIRIGSETHGQAGGRAADVGIGKEEPLGSGVSMKGRG
jgi:hypothetical protein